MSLKRGRNEPCTCGSGKKYKRCCGLEEPSSAAETQLVALINARRFAPAEAIARTLLAAQPDAASVWRMLGQSLWMQGKDALEALQRTAQLLPRDADAQGNLGTALRARGDSIGAVAYYRRALELRPDFAEGHNNLGGALQDLRKFDQALQSYQRALALKPDFAVAHCNIGRTLRSLGRLAEAADHYRLAVSLQPEFNEAYSGLGNTLQDMGAHAEAVLAHRHAASLRPEDPDSHFCLGNALLDSWCLEEAETCYRRALQLNVNFAAAYPKLANTLRLAGRGTAAQQACDRGLEIDPKLVEAWVTRARLLSDQGQFAAAEQALHSAVAIDPDASEAWAGVAGLRKMKETDSAWAAGAERVAALPLPPRRAAALHYAIGKYYDDLKDYERAFDNYRRANDLTKLVTKPHRQESVTQEFNAVIKSHDKDWIADRRLDEQGSERPVFIVGMPRSGTTLLEQIIAAHPSAYGAGELPFWLSSLRDLANLHSLQNVARSDIERLAAEYLRLLDTKSPDAWRVVDKLPGNFECLGLIHAAFPQARIIHATRNPIDTCLSIYFQDFNASHGYANDLGDLAHFHKEYRRLMTHWGDTLPKEKLLEVPYEGLVEDQELWSRRMLDFIGLDWDPRCLEFDRQRKTGNTVLTFSQWQVRQKISGSSVQRWRNYERHIEPLLSLSENA